MKACTKCHESKSFESFARNKRKKDGYQDWCKLCKNGHHKTYYGDNKDRFVAYADKRIKDSVAWMHELKSNPCTVCGDTFHPVAMHFHHRDPTIKLGEVATMVRSVSRQKALEEIAKCDLVCANCHAVITHAPFV